MLMTLIMLNGCVTHYRTEPQNESELLSAVSTQSDRPQLKVLQKRMSACIAQYVISSAVNDNLTVDYRAENQKVSYHSTNAELATYISVCAGSEYSGKDKDSGTITISGKEA